MRQALVLRPDYSDISPKKIIIMPLQNLAGHQLRTQSGGATDWVFKSKEKQDQEFREIESEFWKYLEIRLVEKGYQVMSGGETMKHLKESNLEEPWPADKVAKKIKGDGMFYVEVLRWDASNVDEMGSLAARIRFRLVEAKTSRILWEDENRIRELSENQTLLGQSMERFIRKLVIDGTSTLPKAGTAMGTGP